MNKNKKGFTLVEILISVTVLGIVLSGLGFAIIVASKSQASANYSSLSSNLAKKITEELKGASIGMVTTTGGDEETLWDAAVENKTVKIGSYEYKVSLVDDDNNKVTGQSIGKDNEAEYRKNKNRHFLLTYVTDNDNQSCDVLLSPDDKKTDGTSYITDINNSGSESKTSKGSAVIVDCLDNVVASDISSREYKKSLDIVLDAKESSGEFLATFDVISNIIDNGNDDKIASYESIGPDITMKKDSVTNRITLYMDYTSGKSNVININIDKLTGKNVQFNLIFVKRDTTGDFKMNTRSYIPYAFTEGGSGCSINVYKDQNIDSDFVVNIGKFNTTTNRYDSKSAVLTEGTLGSIPGPMNILEKQSSDEYAGYTDKIYNMTTKAVYMGKTTTITALKVD